MVSGAYVKIDITFEVSIHWLSDTCGQWRDLSEQAITSIVTRLSRLLANETLSCQ